MLLMQVPLEWGAIQWRGGGGGEVRTENQANFLLPFFCELVTGMPKAGIRPNSDLQSLFFLARTECYEDTAWDVRTVD